MESLAVQPSPPIRASDEDRERTVAILGEHYRAGRLDTTEFEARCEEAWGSRMISNLWHAVRELPLAPPPAALPAATESDRAVAGFVTTVIAACILIMSFGLFSVISIPASAVGWRLGLTARRRGKRQGLATAAEVIGFLGVLFGVLALVVWIGLITSMNEGGAD